MSEVKSWPERFDLREGKKECAHYSWQREVNLTTLLDIYTEAVSSQVTHTKAEK